MKAMLGSTLFLALLALPLAAQPGPDHGSRPNSRPERIARALQLTEVQKASIQGIRAKHHPDLILRRDAVKHARIDLRTAIAAEQELDEAAAHLTAIRGNTDRRRSGCFTRQRF